MLESWASEVCDRRARQHRQVQYSPVLPAIAQLCSMGAAYASIRSGLAWVLLTSPDARISDLLESNDAPLEDRHSFGSKFGKMLACVLEPCKGDSRSRCHANGPLDCTCECTVIGMFPWPSHAWAILTGLLPKRPSRHLAVTCHTPCVALVDKTLQLANISPLILHCFFDFAHVQQ